MAKEKRSRRPRAGSGDTLSERFEMRLRATEKQAFQKAAELTGLELADWMRVRLRRAAITELQDFGITPAFLVME